MGTFKNLLPDEFSSFTITDKSYSLLIKGLPGTGKSSLALELVARSPNSFFISTRIDPEAIIEDSLWLNDLIPKDRKYPFFIDATRSGKVSENKMVPKMNFETIPEFVQQLFNLGTDLSNRIFVIDSWNAVVGNLSETQIHHWESAIVQRVQGKNDKIIFVEEGIKDSTLDWMVDGHAVLSKRSIISSYGISRRIRELSFPKMRGIEISNETYLTTLSTGRMKTFPPFKYRFPAILLKSKTIPDSDEQHISSGSADFDILLGGGFQKGSYNFFEVSTIVGDGLDIILFPLITNHLNNKRAIISILREGITFDTKKPYYDVFTGNKNWVNQARYFERFVPGEESHRITLPKTIEELLKLIENIKENFRKENNQTILINIGLDVLENMYGIPALNEFIAILVSKARLEGDVVVGWLKENQEYRGGTTAATSHWKIDLINRALVLEGIIPATEYYAIESVLVRGYIDYTITPVL
ncbi:MAG: gas vesicle protein GvpD P-loop domain-containing protein [Candidatus Hodarchaeales archaeon]|jgi:KaiC/GvpD/RAD55 family RecA-like ATPase